MSFVYKFIVPMVAGTSQCCRSKKVAKSAPRQVVDCQTSLELEFPTQAAIYKLQTQ